MGQGGEGGEHLAPALGQGGAAQHTVGHVRAHRLANMGQLLRGEGVALQPIQGPEDGGGIAAASGHAGTHRDMLRNGDVQVPGGAA